MKDSHKVNWMTPKKYGLTDEMQLKESGLMNIMNLLGIEDHNELLTVTNEDEENVYEMCEFAKDNFREIKQSDESTLFQKLSLDVVVSYYEGGLGSISIKAKDEESFNKQLLSFI
jgi:hypothetical protein